MCLVRDESSRYPRFSYPANEFPPHLRIHRLASTMLCHDTVMASRSNNVHVTISLPQFLTAGDREKVHAMDIGEGIAPVRYVLLRPGKPGRGKDPAVRPWHTKYIDAIESELIGLLNGLKDNNTEDTVGSIYHATIVDGIPVWTKGALRTHLHDDSLSGSYRLNIRNNQFTYKLQGRILGIEQTQQCHLVAWLSSTTSDHPDAYAISCVFERKSDVMQEHICGVWTGTTAWRSPDSRFAPYSGCVVIAHDLGREFDIEQLNSIAKSYVDRHHLTEPQCAAERIIGPCD